MRRRSSAGVKLGWATRTGHGAFAMKNGAMVAALLGVSGPAAALAVPSAGGVQIAQLNIQQRVIIRVPTRPEPPERRMRYREKDGPECIDASALAGAQVGPDGVDLLLNGGTRLRARLSNACPSLNYYSGFYVRPGRDGRICEDRDSIRTRAGGSCEIDRFRRLVPDKRDRRRR